MTTTDSFGDDNSLSSADSFGDDNSLSSADSFGDDEDDNDVDDDDDDGSDYDDDGDIDFDSGFEYDGQHNPPSVGNPTVAHSDTDHGANASTQELYHQCLAEIDICLALHPPEVRAAAISFVNSIEDGGVVFWTQALCPLRNMSFASGCGCSIPVNVNSPSIKFTREVLHKIVKEKNAVNYDCNIRHTCERNDKDTNCEDAKNSEADALAPLIVSVAKYAISRGNTYLVLNVGGKSIGRVLFPKSRRN